MMSNRAVRLTYPTGRRKFFFIPTPGFGTAGPRGSKLVLHCRIDHIVITASSLAEGEKYIYQTLGVMPQIGGTHPRMGTHNSLLRLGEAMYLEVVAVNPDSPPPNRPRWFELDQLDPNAPPRLATWVARTNHIRDAVEVSQLPLGSIEAMSRGELNWLITIPEDGKLPAQGIAPTLIQWPVGPHPASSLQDLGCSLIRLEGYHPKAQEIADMLKSLGFEGAYSITPLLPGKQPYLVAHIQTPSGVIRLSTP